MRSPLPKIVSKKVITSDKNEVSEKKIVTPCPELLKVQEIMKKHNIKPFVKVSQKALEAINSGLEEAKKGVFIDNDQVLEETDQLIEALAIDN